ncbi:MAG: tRNA dihydrouridine synthase DusB [Paracoccaceae bacterium]
MAIQLADQTLDPPVFLAPLAGITDLPFRTLVRSFGAGLVVSEMIASREMVTARPSARARAELGLGVGGTAVQIAGRETHWMAECARLCAAGGARIIDINMGCPAKKVIGGLSGAALMRNPDHALRLIEAVVGAVEIPVTLKMRLGWDADEMTACDLARRAEGAGVGMITVHGRTRAQFYRGRADWRRIGDVVDAVEIPVIANGDIASAQDARAALALSGAAGVMIGRAARGRPWLAARIAAELSGGRAPVVPKGAALGEMVIAHHEAMLAFYGRDLGLRVARKHLGWYLDGIAIPREERRAVLTAREPEQVHRLIRRAFSHRAGRVAA